MKFRTDAKNYGGADSGCQVASEFLGHQSSCRNCPFDECVYRLPTKGNSIRNKEIIKSWKDDTNPKELALMFKLSKSTIYRVIYG